MIARIGLVAAGAVMAAYGLWRLLTSAHLIAVRSAVTWFIGGALAHDVVLAPAVIVVGAVLARWCPPPVRPFLQAGLIMTGGLTLVAIPVLTGRGYSPKVPSALPLNYWHGYLIAVGCIWAAVALAGAFQALRRRRQGVPGTTLPVRR
ncbi:MAG TPA: hypothetical protein VHC49_00670 [Mycobacteriales bacterium]|nr:hypothetical protein [Mycobacteriales bacterium]